MTGAVQVHMERFSTAPRSLRVSRSEMTVLGDSGAGIITDQWFADSFPNWNAEAALPSWFELPGGTVEGLTIVDVYTEIANHPNARFAQYTTAFDSNQEFYFSAMGGDEVNWSKQMSRHSRISIQNRKLHVLHSTGRSAHHSLQHHVHASSTADSC